MNFIAMNTNDIGNLRLNKIKLKAAGCLLVLLLFSSCRTHKMNYDFRELAEAAVKLEMDIDMKDNHALYVESSKWIGTPYRYGGTTKKGVDCSGFTKAIYKKVYNEKLGRSAEEQRDDDCRRVLKRNLKEGDLVFFHNGRKKRKASHVGIYLKDDKFIHASTSVGVVVSSLKEKYYDKHWLQGGRVK